jgi:small subunit ribosomal protein S6
MKEEPRRERREDSAPRTERAEKKTETTEDNA